MSFETFIFETLSAEAGVDDRVYPAPLEFQRNVTYPAITYQRVSTSRVRSHDGTSLVGPLFQVTVWSGHPKEAHEVARAVIAAFESRIGRALIQNTAENFAPEPKISQVFVDVRLWAGLGEEVDVAS